MRRTPQIRMPYRIIFAAFALPWYPPEPYSSPGKVEFEPVLFSERTFKRNIYRYYMAGLCYVPDCTEKLPAILVLGGGLGFSA